MKSTTVEQYKGFEIQQTDNDGFGVAGFGFFPPGHHTAWVGTFPTMESARAAVDRRQEPPRGQTATIAKPAMEPVRICSRCNQSDMIGGKMFTTDPASGLCDDCYG